MNKLTLSKLILILSDLVSLILPFFISLYLVDRYGQGHTLYFQQENFYNYIIIHLIIASITVIWFWMRLRHYTYRKPFWFELKEILRSLFIFFMIELTIIGLSKLYISRSFWLMAWGFVFTFVPFIRVLTKNILIKSKLYLKETIIIGNGTNAQDVYDAITSESYLGFNIKLFVSTDDSDIKWIKNIPVSHHNPELLLQITNKELTQFILAIDDKNIEKQDFWLRFLMKKGCRAVSVIPDLRGVPLYGTDMSFLFSHDLILLRLNNNLAKRSSRMIKRSFDILGSLILIFLLIPFFVIVSYFIKKDRGNIIYKHKRIGRNHKEFNCYKFRSMVMNSQDILYELLKNNAEAKLEWEKDFKLKHDPRITPIGKFLRRTSLDELPQLFNVLKGDMSLVGPRPITKEELIKYQDDLDYYLIAKPGMTGLWQVSGRNDVDYETRVYLDSWYTKNWSLWNDFVILCKTVNILIKKKNGAY